MKENLDSTKKDENPKISTKKESIFLRFKKVKHIEIIIAVAAVMVMLAIYFAGFKGTPKKKNNPTNETIYSDYCRQMQQDVTDYVAKIKGAGDAKTIINWESSVELIIAATESNSSSSSNSTPTIITSSGNSVPIILKEIYPKAIGVVVVCEGGSDPSVKVNIIMSVSTLLNIESDKIIVLPMQKNK